MKLVLATTNKGKLKEIKKLAEPLGIDILLMSDLEFHKDIEETGSTFEENALIKAREVAKALNLAALADDSGLEVEALDGLPGVKSARFAGEKATDQENNKKLKQMLENVPLEKRTAAFVCCMAVSKPDGTSITAHGRFEGRIAIEPKGENGFGYDPWFELPEKGLTVAQLTSQEKNAISHRALALKNLMPKLESFLKNK